MFAHRCCNAAVRCLHKTKSCLGAISALQSRQTIVNVYTLFGTPKGLGVVLLKKGFLTHFFLLNRKNHTFPIFFWGYPPANILFVCGNPGVSNLEITSTRDFPKNSDSWPAKKVIPWCWFNPFRIWGYTFRKCLVNMYVCMYICIYIYTGWLFGTWLLFFYIYIYIGNVIIPTDFHIFQGDWNHQPVLYLFCQLPIFFTCDWLKIDSEHFFFIFS